MEINEKLSILRREMSERGLSAYIIPSSDFHGSEYVGEYFKAREFMSGFTGSAGTLVVTPEFAGLWTDGRYFLQAAAELAGSGIELMKLEEAGVPEIEEYLADKLPERAVIGFDGRTVSCQFAEKLRKKTAKKKITFAVTEDLVDIIWTNRPPLSAETVWELAEGLADSRKDKLQRVREKLDEENCGLLLISCLEEIAWLTNLRGGDVESTPVFLSYMLLSQNEARLYANEAIFSAGIKEKLRADGIEIRPYDDIYDAVKAECAGKQVWADEKRTNYRLMDALSAAAEVTKTPDPIDLMKAIKTKNEQEGERQAHIRDGVAVTHFIYWLKNNVAKQTITELDGVEKLLEFRKAQKGFIEPSFATIMAYGAHGAIVHYDPSPETNIVIEPRGLALLDSGGQYRDGTTDITRTVVVGELTEEEKRAFTLVLKSHLRLGAARFLYGCGGAVLDTLARAPFWEQGLSYKHGTGHGVGFVLSVHEGPQRINYKGSDSEVKLEVGMITSNEPGYYVTGKFGVRHENLVVCVEDETTEYGRFLRFENLTMVPFDKEGIDVSLLDEKEKASLNAYHRQVWEKLSPYFEGEEKDWLRAATSAIE